jgi:hypothetical protein
MLMPDSSKGLTKLSGFVLKLLGVAPGRLKWSNQYQELVISSPKLDREEKAVSYKNDSRTKS